MGRVATLVALLNAMDVVCDGLRVHSCKKEQKAFGDECVHWVPALHHRYAGSDMKKLKMP